MKKRYELIKNIIFSFSYMLEWGKVYLLYDAVIRARDLFDSFVTVALISFVIGLLVEKNVYVFYGILAVSVFGAAMDLLVNRVQTKKDILYESLYIKYQRMLYLKTFRTDYQNLENPAYTDNYSIALQNTVNGCSPVNLTSDVSEIIFALCGVVLFGGVVSSLSFWVLLTVFFYSVATLVCSIKLNEWFEQTRKENVRKDRKEAYYTSLYADLGFAKDARLFNMKWLILPELEAIHLAQKQNQTKFETRKLCISFLLLFLSLAQQAFMYYYVIRALTDGSLSAGQFMLYTSSVAYFGHSFMQIIAGIARLNADNMKTTACS